jgi:hypothetical protein
MGAATRHHSHLNSVEKGTIELGANIHAFPFFCKKDHFLIIYLMLPHAFMS